MDEKQKPERIQTVPGQLPVNQETLDILVANIIPTSKYFEARFDHLEHRVIKIEEDLGEFRRDVGCRFNEMNDAVNLRFEHVDRRFDEMRDAVNLRFEHVDKRLDEVNDSVNLRFEQVDKRFEQVDKRFEQVDRHLDEMRGETNRQFEQMIHSIDRLTDTLENRDHVQRSFTLRMFSVAIAISFVGVLGVFLKIFN